ncbi:DUF2997 domain-containing protein [Micromonospora globbae]|uniref:DUF2997 domain-containing protein n=1 Tax=Micromonospora globbae TaxID=1894969 RepID=A0ABZ1S0K0_9ACTN|nr:DUF2997 domain-containing protein [Micromonospora globbae]
MSSEGVVSAETRGLLGDRCLDYVTVLEDLLAAQTVSSAYTADHARGAATVHREEHDVERA